ncbi:hypothetical protein EON63_20285 [archaeon]|nr:MAG: hypothetical protein EON63_20285 [archaeon]
MPVRGREEVQATLEAKEPSIKTEDSVDPEKEDENDEQSSKRRQCPYLDTVNRQLLDFDCEKLCSVTLTNRNVYACLVCGKFFEGRGKNTAAYTHSLQAGHYVYMHMESARSYCLPDNYEIFDSSLRDIQRCLNPRFNLAELRKLENNANLVRDVHGMTYLPGFMGINNLSQTDDLSVLLHALGHVKPFREFFLQQELYNVKSSALVLEFGLVSLLDTCVCVCVLYMHICVCICVWLCMYVYVHVCVCNVCMCYVHQCT